MNFFSRNTGRRASINLDSGEAVQGVIVRSGPFRIIVGGAELVDQSGRRPLSGAVEIPRRRVVWIEVE